MDEKINSLIIRILYFLICGIVVSQTRGMYAVSSLCFTGVMGLTVCLWVSCAMERIGRVSFLAVITSLIAGANVLINMALQYRIFEYSSLSKLISFILALLYFGMLCETRTDRSTAKFVLRLNTALGLYLVAMYLLQRDMMHLLNGYVWRYLTFRFLNPNQTAVFLLCCCLLEMIQVYRRSSVPEKLLHLALSVVLSWFVYKTGSRNCLIPLCAFWLVCLVSQFRSGRSLRMPRWAAAGVALFPWLFSLAYLALVNNEFLLNLFSFMTNSGKSLSSRAEIWGDAYAGFLEAPLTGAFAQLLDRTGQFHMHNSHVDTLAFYGVLVFILFMIFLYMVLISAGKDRAEKMNQAAVYAFAALLLTGMGEATLFSGGLGIYAYAGVFLLIANADFEGKSL